MTKPTNRRVDAIEGKLDADSNNPIRVHLRPDLSYEQARELARSLPTADERGRPIINLVFSADDCVL
jgi:hypothetical protein